MIRGPKIVVVYTYALAGANGYRDKALQFVDSYNRHPPGLDHETVIVCNGIPANDDTRVIFASLPGLAFLDHDDSGWDIGAFQKAAREIPCDLMVFCGGHTYFRKPNWLARMWEVYATYGNTLYGSTGNQGNIGIGVHPHVRTTGFWCHPSLMNEYPHRIVMQGGGGDRYQFEHGDTCISNWVRRQGLTPWIVGFQEMAPLMNCDSLPHGYHKNSQDDLLVGDRMTMPPFYHCP